MTKAYSYLRTSTQEQLRGDSMRRQLEQSRKYAAVHGLDLVESDEMKDVGVSAFKGLNATEGQLAGFLRLVRRKKIPVGSYLLVENLDRLSREHVFKAFGLFSEIVSAGVIVVTLKDGLIFDSKPDLGQMITSIVSMSRANEESELKRYRGSAAWVGKRQNADKKILTRLCPAWLSPKADRTGFNRQQRTCRSREENIRQLRRPRNGNRRHRPKLKPR